MTFSIRYRPVSTPRYRLCTPDVEPAWDPRRTRWRVRVRGDAPLDVTLDVPIPLDDLGAFTPASRRAGR
jgi:hypothetical protein